MSEPKVHIIVATTLKGVIGNKGDLPWRLKQDMAHFKEMTMGHPVIMGRKTWDSIPKKYRPLEGRINLVVSRNEKLKLPNIVARMGSVENAIRLAKGMDREKVFIIGGSQIYEAALPNTDVINFTTILKDFDGDTFFPKIPNDFKESSRSQTFREEGVPFYYIDYERKK